MFFSRVENLLRSYTGRAARDAFTITSSLSVSFEALLDSAVCLTVAPPNQLRRVEAGSAADGHGGAVDHEVLDVEVFTDYSSKPVAVGTNG
jgi:hypothetical protein